MSQLKDEILFWGTLVQFEEAVLKLFELKIEMFDKAKAEMTEPEMIEQCERLIKGSTEIKVAQEKKLRISKANFMIALTAQMFIDGHHDTDELPTENLN